MQPLDQGRPLYMSPRQESWKHTFMTRENGDEWVAFPRVGLK